MQAEYRIIMTVTFVDAASRDAAYPIIKTAMTNFGAAHPNAFKRADMTKDDYTIPDAIGVTEKVL